jgi:hypothetical protein
MFQTLAVFPSSGKKHLKYWTHLDQAILSHCAQKDRSFLPEDGSRAFFRSAVIQCLCICKKWANSKRRILYLYVILRRPNFVVLKSHLISKFSLYCNAWCEANFLEVKRTMFTDKHI